MSQSGMKIILRLEPQSASEHQRRVRRLLDIISALATITAAFLTAYLAKVDFNPIRNIDQKVQMLNSQGKRTTHRNTRTVLGRDCPTGRKTCDFLRAKQGTPTCQSLECTLYLPRDGKMSRLGMS